MHGVEVPSFLQHRTWFPRIRDVETGVLMCSGEKQVTVIPQSKNDQLRRAADVPMETLCRKDYQSSIDRGVAFRHGDEANTPRSMVLRRSDRQQVACKLLPKFNKVGDFKEGGGSGIMIHHNIMLAITNSHEGLNNKRGPPSIMHIAEAGVGRKRNNNEDPALCLQEPFPVVKYARRVFPVIVCGQRFTIGDDADGVGSLICRIGDNLLY